MAQTVIDHRSVVAGIARQMLEHQLTLNGDEGFGLDPLVVFGPDFLLWSFQVEDAVTKALTAGNHFVNEEQRTVFTFAWIRNLLDLAYITAQVWESDKRLAIHAAEETCRSATDILIYPDDGTQTEAPLDVLARHVATRDRAIENAQRAMLTRLMTAHDHALARFKRMIAVCESPLESAFLIGLATHCRSDELHFASMLNERYFACQYPVGRYRVDFAVFLGDGRRKVALEVDGHTYHERTVEQAVHDRARDRELQKHSWDVLRFHRKEVEDDLAGCAASVQAHLLRLTGRQ